MHYFGCSGWHYPDWEGRFYPDGLPSNRWLSFYATKFNTLEINMTFYRLPFPNMVKEWHNNTPKDFIFTMKGHRWVTHVKKLRHAKRYIRLVYKNADLLKEKLGCVLWQLPPSLKLDLDRLDNFCKDLSSSYTNVIEFRHRSWFCSEAFKVLRCNKMTSCIVSGPSIPEMPKVTSNVAYIRFHGKTTWYDYNYRKNELTTRAETIKKLKAKDVYCYFNNDVNARSVKNCLQLKRLVG